MSSSSLTAQRQFKIDSQQGNADVVVEAHKQALEEEARHELDEKMGNTLADFQTWPTWTVENDENTHIYTLNMRVVFKP